VKDLNETFSPAYMCFTQFRAELHQKILFSLKTKSK